MQNGILFPKGKWSDGQVDRFVGYTGFTATAGMIFGMIVSSFVGWY